MAKREIQDRRNRFAALAPIKLTANTSLFNTVEKMQKDEDKKEPANIGVDLV